MISPGSLCKTRSVLISRYGTSDNSVSVEKNTLLMLISADQAKDEEYSWIEGYKVKLVSTELIVYEFFFGKENWEDGNRRKTWIAQL